MEVKKKLIDPEALIEEVNRTAEITKKRREQFSLRNLIMCIKIAPAVDAVRVVRCKNCKCFDDYFIQCNNPKGLRAVGSNSFCPYGERKENGTT